MSLFFFVADKVPKSIGKHYYIPVGKLMFDAGKTGKALPQVFKDDFSDEIELQQLIISMCAVKGLDRIRLNDVKRKLWKLCGMLFGNCIYV